MALENEGRDATELSDSVTLDAVQRSSGELTLSLVDENGLTTSLAVAPAHVSDTVTSIDGLLTWQGEDANTSAVVQPIADGIRVMSVFETADAPSEAVTDFDAGVEIEPTFFDDGAVVLHSATDGRYLGLIESRWAVDASGRSVTTWYEWRSGSLVQKVAHTGADYQYPIVADPAWTYAFDFPALSAAGYASPGMDALTAMSELRRCFNCSFPISGAPAQLSTVGVINLNASPFSLIEVRAPVKATQLTGVGFTFVAQAGHFDGAGSEIRFRFYATCSGGRPWLRLSVNATVIKDRGAAANAANAAMAQRQWQRFLNNTNENAISRNGLSRC